MCIQSKMPKKVPTDEDFIVDSAVAFPIGTSFIFARRASGEVNIIPAGATIILSANGATNLTYKDSGATLIKVSATEWYLFGDIGAPITAAPGGSDREIQFNDGGVAFGGATGFTYDPANTNGIVELISTLSAVILPPQKLLFMSMATPPFNVPLFISAFTSSIKA